MRTHRVRLLLFALVICFTGCRGQKQTNLETTHTEFIPGLRGLESRIVGPGGSLKERHLPLEDGNASLYFGEGKQLTRSCDFYINSKKPRSEAVWSSDGKDSKDSKDSKVVNGTVRQQDGTVLIEQRLLDDGTLKVTYHLDDGVTAEATTLRGQKTVTWRWKKGPADKQELWFEDVVAQGPGVGGTAAGASVVTTFYRSSSDGLSRLADCTIQVPVLGADTADGARDSTLEVVYYDDSGRALFKQIWYSGVTQTEEGPGSEPYWLKKVQELSDLPDRVFDNFDNFDNFNDFDGREQLVVPPPDSRARCSSLARARSSGSSAQGQDRKNLNQGQERAGTSLVRTHFALRSTTHVATNSQRLAVANLQPGHALARVGGASGSDSGRLALE